MKIIPTMRVVLKETGREALINVADFDSAVHTKIGAGRGEREPPVESAPAYVEPNTEKAAVKRGRPRKEA